MKQVINDVLDKNEIKFWMGVVAVIVSIIVAFYSVKIQIAEMSKDILYLADGIHKVDDKFSEIHIDTVKHEIAIAQIRTFLKLD